MAAKLPTPATAGDMYLYAIVEQLDQLNKTLKELVDIVDEATTPDMPILAEEIELKEPALAEAPQDADAPLTVETVETFPLPTIAQDSKPPKKPAHRDAKQAES